jgi:hypothetical protein
MECSIYSHDALETAFFSLNLGILRRLDETKKKRRTPMKQVNIYFNQIARCEMDLRPHQYLQHLEKEQSRQLSPI